MPEPAFWTPPQLSEYCAGSPTVKTLAKWRTVGGGPPFVKHNRRVYYPIDEAKKWALGKGLQYHTEAA